MKSVRSILAQIKEFVTSSRDNVEAWVERNMTGNEREIPVPEDTAEVVNFVLALWEESRKWRMKSFGGRMSYDDPYQFWKDARRLEEGMHWDVWGHRNTGDDDKWKQEIIDNEIDNQVRLKKSHLTANWHDVDVLPNIQNLNDVLDQERMKTAWGDTIIQGVQRGLTEGMAVFYHILDRTRYADGMARDILLDNESLFPTPHSRGIEILDGCWYLAVTTMASEQQIFQMYPKLQKSEDRIRFSKMSEEIAKFARLDFNNEYIALGDFAHTKMIPIITLYMDDTTVERLQPDMQEIELEHQSVEEGLPIEVSKDNHHKLHIQHHLQFVEEKAKAIDAAQAMSEQGPLQGPDGQPMQEGGEEGVQVGMTGPEVEGATAVAQYMVEHIRDHMKQLRADEARGLNSAESYKYPAGRKIVVAGGVVLEDEPVEAVDNWRDLFSIWYHEKLPYNWWGRGVPEILYSTNKTEDTMLSRDADIAISVGMPKQWFNVNDKDNIDDQGLNNDPTVPGFVQTMPVFRQGQSPEGNARIYASMKINAQKQQGINEMTYGKSPGANVSADMVKTLITQNQVVVTGEANQRLSDTIEHMLKTRFRFWGTYYTEPRFFFFNGVPKAVTLSKMISTFKVTLETGEVVEKKVPEFQIVVRPNSNFPNKFEYELQFLMQLARTPSPDGMPYVPREAVLDILSEKYPKLGKDGEYYQMSEALQKGLAQMAEEQKKQMAEMKTQRTLAGAVRKKGMRELLGDGIMTSADTEGQLPSPELNLINPIEPGGPNGQA